MYYVARHAPNKPMVMATRKQVGGHPCRLRHYHARGMIILDNCELSHKIRGFSFVIKLPKILSQD
jgi:hypothetical protein